MASKSKSAVFEHFTLSSDSKYYVCCCSTTKGDEEISCDSKISASAGSLPKGHAPTRASNLKRHLERSHPEIFKIVVEKDIATETAKSSKFSNLGVASSSKKSSTSLTQSPLSGFLVSDRVTISMTPESFKRNIVKIAVLNCIPLRFFSQPEVLALIGELAKKLGVSLNRDNVRKLIINQYEDEREQLKKVLSNKYVYLKMDACTRHRVNYFAINIRYVNEKDQFITKTLAIKDTEAQHGSNYLSQLVSNVLEDYGIQKDHVLCIVTDNASNMLSLVKQLNEKTREEQERNVQEENLDEPSEAVESTSQSTEGHGLAWEDLLEEDSESFEGFEDEDISSGLDEITETAAYLSDIEHQRCCVHTHQLAVRDGLQEQHSSNLIAKVRRVAIAARTPKLDAILKRRAGKGAIIDQATRWGSTYNMVKRIIELKPFLTDMANPEVSLTQIQWNQVEELEDLLKLPFNVTKKLQEEELTPGMFIKEWSMLEYALSKRGGILAETMYRSMKQRGVKLLNNKILLAGVYVDPMNRVLLSENQKNEAKAALCDIALRISGLNKTTAPENPEHSSTTESEGTCDDDEDDFEKLLDKQDQKMRSKRRRLERTPARTVTSIENIRSNFKLDFNKALEEVEHIDRKSKLDVHEAIKKYPKIVKEAALLVAALPPTQVSVERLFSALKLIRSDQRAAMKEKLTEAILFLRTNN